MWISTLASLLICASLIAGQQPSEPEHDRNVRDSLERIRRGQFTAGDPYRVAQAQAIQAIPALEEQFKLKEDILLKTTVASALVRLGARNPVYWDYLADRARVAVENDAPSIFLTDSQGRIIRGRGKFAPQFEDWAKARGLDPGTAAHAQVYELPSYVTLLAITGDPRGRELLRKGMESRNYLIQATAAKGLAKLKDRHSVPLIIEACKRSHIEIAPLIARALVFFDDPRAQKAAEEFISNAQHLQELRKRAREGADPFLF